MAPLTAAMSTPNLPPPPTLRTDFPRKVAILFLFVIDTAIAIFFLFRQNPEANTLLRHLVADILIGLIAGIAARILFRKRSAFIRYITATAALICGLLLLGAMSGWRTGIGPLSFSRTTIDWSGLAQVSLTTICMIWSMQVWSRPAPQIAGNAVPVTPAVQPEPPQTRQKSRFQPRPKRKRKRTPENPSTATPPQPSSQPARQEHSQEPAKSATRRKRSVKSDLQPVPDQRPKVRLSKIEKHLCPYCLEPVIARDPRGIVECDICHTQHHADCWSIAGACQVPHYTA